MRILMSSDAVGGLGMFAQELAVGLRGRGHQVEVAVIGSPEWPYRLEWMDAGEDAARLAALTGDTAQLRRQFACAAAAFRPDVVHANHFVLANAAGGVATVLGVHSDVVSWWRHVHCTTPPATAFQRWYAGQARAALAKAAVVVTPTASAARDVRDSFGWRGDVRVIANGREASQIPPFRKERLVVAVGRVWDQAKQMHLLANSGGDIVILGETRHPVSGAADAPMPGLRLLGPATAREVADWMARARIFVSASCYEPFGLAALEAALAGCTLLLNDIPSHREVWGDTAHYFDARQAGALTAALGRLLAGDRGGDRARRRAQARYSAARMIAGYEHLYRWLKPPCKSATSPTPGCRTGTTATPTSCAAG